MLISYTHKFIFFHVAKVAGISIREALKEYAQEPRDLKLRRPPEVIGGNPNPMYAMWETYLLHTRARDAARILPAEVYHSFYKFAFVRNPWDWQVSMYHFLLKETGNPRYDLVRSLPGFDAYLEWVIQTEKPYPRGAAKFQHEMVVDQTGTVLVDFVGRFETLSEDIAHVGQHLNIDIVLPYLNQSQHRDYRSYYNEHTRALVAEHFREDIERFAYRFG